MKNHDKVNLSFQTEDSNTNIELEKKLTHFLREAGRYLHPGPKEKGSQKEILLILHKENEMTQSKLAETLHKTPAAISEIVRKLDKKELVKRVPNENDRRYYDIELTEHGKQIALEFEEEHEQQGSLYSILSESEEQELYTLLEKLIKYWRKTRKVHEPPKPPKPPISPKDHLEED